MIAAPTLALFLAASSQAATPCPERAERRLSPCLPSQPERAELAGLIKSALDEYARYEAARVKEGRLRARYFLEEQPRDATTDAARLAKLGEWQAELVGLKEIETKMKKSFELAAAETARRFGVSPRSERTHVAGGILRGGEAAWAPTMQEAKDGYFYSQREVGVLPFGRDKKAAYLKYESIDRGDPADEKDDWERQSETLDDGSVLISIRLFQLAQDAKDGEGDPAILAAHLALERARFEKKTCPETALGCRLQGGRDGLKRELVELHGIRESLAAADAIGLDPDYKAKLEGRLARLDYIRKEADGGRRSLSDAFSSADESKSNMIEWGKYQAQLRAIRNQQSRLRSRLEARQRGEPEAPFLRDALNERRPPEGAVSDDGCSSTGFWAGDV